MKKLFCTLAAIAVFASSALADEGMWMLPLLQKMNAKQMKELGCQLSPKQIYNINNSLKDAIVQFGGGCTGEIISKEGLLVTNHHCGYGSIQKLSSVEHDYLKDGFWAMNRAEELPCEGLTVTFLKYMEDVTGDLEKAEKKAAKEYEGQENAEELIGKAVAAKAEELKKAAEKKNPNCRVYIENFYNENVQYLIVYKIYKDIRFVGAPPSSIGKFGADTDNWMWPRHTGDFSMFRVYADKNGEPAEYSADNVPLKTKNHLKISTAGVNEGDFTMIMGYPGRTTRFQTSPELRNQIALNDVRIAARTVRQDVMLEDMLADPKVKIQYASKYSGSTNGWKKWQGMKLAFDKLDIIGRAEQEEADFQKWADAKADRKAKYGNAITALAEAAAVGQEENIIYTYINESLARIELVNAAANVVANLTAAGKNGLEGDAAWKAACGKMQDFYKDYSESTDRKVAKALIRFYRDNVDSKWYPEIENFATMDVDAYVDAMFDASVFSSPEKLAAANAEALAGDPATAFLASLRGSLTKVIPAVMAGNEAAAAARKTYTAGLLEWKKGEPSYPDANFTMRCTYGTVKGYSPKDAVIYRHYTTLDGVMV